MNDGFFCTSLCIRSLEDHLFTIKDITQRFGALLSAIVVTFFTGSAPCDAGIVLKNRSSSRACIFFIRPCLSHIHLLRSCSTCSVITRVMGTFGYAAPEYVSTDRDARRFSRKSGIDKLCLRKHKRAKSLSYKVKMQIYI
ncbi:hypothetical protein Bca4012_036490 [Brassica carinata]|uniref:Uncharacterized protein n=1 Tax=Brassica carinata TaxID=52824 RepID=A0A8X7VUA1_BRACI|nr:hypothetical protein Bca52824_020858 [Brassica carinata]KAG2327473.1 hypothetical protein Bca52824_010201 [Brassica carinata]